MTVAKYIRSLMCQEMPTGLYTRWGYDSETYRFKARKTEQETTLYQELRPECEIECFYPNGKPFDCFDFHWYCDHCKTIFESMGFYYFFCSCQETGPYFSKQDNKRENKRREKDELRGDYIK